MRHNTCLDASHAFATSDKFTFAVTFAYAHVYLDDSKTEADFGLKVAINAVSDEKLRSVERSNIGAAIRDFAQAAGQRDLRTFGFDDALDLIRKISGRAADKGFADTVTHSDFRRGSILLTFPMLPLRPFAFFNQAPIKRLALGSSTFLRRYLILRFKQIWTRR